MLDADLEKGSPIAVKAGGVAYTGDGGDGVPCVMGPLLQ